MRIIVWAITITNLQQNDQFKSSVGLFDGLEKPAFSNTPVGAQSSAVIYSPIETAKENDPDPYRYLVWLLSTAPGLSQADETWAEPFLPMDAPQECKIPKS